jgi:DegV family protein with EDD domain
MNAQKIAVIADTGCDIPKRFYEREDFFVLHFRVIYQEGEYIDGVTIEPEEVYERLDKEIPKTSLPNGHDIMNVFDQVKEAGYEHVLVIAISSKLSGTCNFLQLLAKDYQGLDIRVLDTKNIGIGSGMFGIDAFHCIDKGMDFEAIWQRMQDHVTKSKVFFSLGTLEYLRKGGRIGRVASLLGTAINIKPIISCDPDGVYYTVKKARGRKASFRTQSEEIKKYIGTHRHYMMAYCWGHAVAEDIRALTDLVKEEAAHAEYLLDDVVLSPALAINTGPGLLGIGIYLLD